MCSDLETTRFVDVNRLPDIKRESREVGKDMGLVPWENIRALSFVAFEYQQRALSKSFSGLTWLRCSMVGLCWRKMHCPRTSSTTRRMHIRHLDVDIVEVRISAAG